MKTILRKVVSNNFTIVSNNMIQNPNMSNKARGMYVYMLSMPDNWQFCVADLVNRSTDGRDGVKQQLKELEEIGYIKHGGQSVNDDGTFGPSCVLVRSSMDLPWPDEPLTVEPVTDIPVTDIPVQQSTHSTKNPETKNPETKNPDNKTQDRDLVWEAYVNSCKEVNPASTGGVFDAKRQALIDKALTGYSVEDVILAVTGWAKSDWHTGDNPTGAIHKGLKLILNDSDSIERFMSYHNAEKPINKGRINDLHRGNDQVTPAGIIEIGDDEEDFIDD